MLKKHEKHEKVTKNTVFSSFFDVFWAFFDPFLDVFGQVLTKALKGLSKMTTKRPCLFGQPLKPVQNPCEQKERKK